VHRELRGFGVDTSAIIRGGDRMGIYFLENGAVSRASKVIYDRAHSAIADIKPGMIDWEKVFEGATWFHWTELPRLSRKAPLRYAPKPSLLLIKKGITVSCDLNYRKNLWKYGKKATEVMRVWLLAAISFWGTKKMPPWP
jgi:2-dehydro-3-deoxygluconokinase